MSSPARAGSHEEFVCAVCQDLFSDPATIPCGHSFCLPCIASYWELCSGTREVSCPQCLRTFTPKPTLQKNLTLCEVLEDLRASGEISAGSRLAGPGDVTCDVCTKTKTKGRKSCLHCLLTYCGYHLQPHHHDPVLRDHILVDPLKHLHAQRDCAAHGEPLDWFCWTDGENICRYCAVEQHTIHEVVTVPEEVAQQQKLIQYNSSTLKRKLQKTLAETSDLQLKVDSVKNLSQEVRTEITQKFTAMVKLIEEANKEAIGQINNDEQAMLGQAKSIRAQLQQRCTELTTREHQLRTLLKIDDNLIFLQESNCFKASVQPLEFPQFKQKIDAQSTMACVKVAVNDLAALTKQHVISFRKQIQDNQNIDNPKKVRIKKVLPYSNARTGMTKEDFLNSTPSIMELPKSGLRMQLLRFQHQHLHICTERTESSNKGPNNNLSWCLDLHLTPCNTFLVFADGVESEIPSVSYNRIGMYLRADTLSFYGVTDTMTLIHKFSKVYLKEARPAFRIENETVLTLCQLRPKGEKEYFKKQGLSARFKRELTCTHYGRSFKQTLGRSPHRESRRKTHPFHSTSDCIAVGGSGARGPGSKQPFQKEVTRAASYIFQESIVRRRSNRVFKLQEKSCVHFKKIPVSLNEDGSHIAENGQLCVGFPSGCMQFTGGTDEEEAFRKTNPNLVKVLIDKRSCLTTIGAVRFTKGRINKLKTQYRGERAYWSDEGKKVLAVLTSDVD
ncbi:tripartite motif-containing protein 16-like [Rhincodon typus]|uniref:tripartite motif-containing protein 16-like n=1 Tax=Rhincodon typus TaxID=259920 RepID=UPI00202E8A59|nr:tripartite motif-containing protein 16-like [Rhincodon typus]